MTAAWTDRDWETWFRETVIPSGRWARLMAERDSSDEHMMGFVLRDGAAEDFAKDWRTGQPDWDLVVSVEALARVDGLGDTSAHEFSTLSPRVRREFMAGWNRLHAAPAEPAELAEPHVPAEQTESPEAPEPAESIVPELTPGGGLGRNWRLWAIPVVIAGFVAGWTWLGGIGTEDEARSALGETARPSTSSTVGSSPTGTPGSSHRLAFGDAALDRVMTSAGMFSVGYDAVRLESAVDLPDEPGGWFDSISTAQPGYRGDEVDIRRTIAFTARVSQAEADATFNRSALECGQPEPLVICAPGVLPMPEGDLLVVAVEHGADVPAASTDRSYVYAVVLDSDGNGANDWRPQPPFDWDYFGGTDRWYQATYDHEAGTWSLLVTQLRVGGADYGQPTAARAIVSTRWLVWLLPIDELPGYPSPLRATAFAHDGHMTPSSRGGDVSEANPTEALIVPPPLE